MSLLKVKNNPCIVAVFDDEEPLLDAARLSRDRGYRVYDVFTPFPVHGLERVLGIARSNLAVAAFIFGFLGFSCALVLTTYTMHLDWPNNIGGKPTWPLTSFIPATFELTVLFASLGMTFTYYWICGMLPGVQPVIYDLRATSDRFVMLIEDGTNGVEIREAMHQLGAVDVRDDNYISHNFPGPVPLILKRNAMIKTNQADQA